MENMTMPEFSAGLEKTRTIVIPFGATEEHGSHLPLATDTLQAMDVARLAAEQRPLFVAPPVHYGVCRSTRRHPGTVSISTMTLQALTVDMVSSLHEQGLENFVLLSGHAGGTHMAALVDAGEKLLDMFSTIRVAVLCEYQLVKEAGAGIIETPGDSHAGEIETSRILHAHPLLVKGPGEEEYPTFSPGLLVRDKRRYWEGGVWGNPRLASAEKGEKLEKAVVAALVDFIGRMEN